MFQVYLAYSLPTPSGFWSWSQYIIPQDVRNHQIRQNFPQVPVCTHGQRSRPGDIQPNLVEWRHRMGLQFKRSHKNSVVSSSKLGTPKKPPNLDKSLATAYVHMISLFPCTTGIRIPSQAVQVRLLEARFSYRQPQNFREVTKHWRDLQCGTLNRETVHTGTCMWLSRM